MVYYGLLSILVSAFMKHDINIVKLIMHVLQDFNKKVHGFFNLASVVISDGFSEVKAG